MREGGLTGTNVGISMQPQTDRCPDYRYNHRDTEHYDWVFLNPVGLTLPSCDAEKSTSGNRQDPIVGLNDEPLGHESIEGAEPSKVRIADEPPREIDCGRRHEINCHQKVAGRESPKGTSKIGVFFPSIPILTV